MKPSRLIWITALLFLLGGCASDDKGDTSSGGGGGSSTPQNTAPAEGGSGDNSSDNSTPDSGSGGDTPLTGYAGTYTGTASYKASGLGITKEESEPVTVVIDDAGNVSVDGESVGKLTNDSISSSYTGTETVGDLTCTGTITVNASISGNTISGRFPPTTLDCNGLPVEVEASFSATRS
jgi:hypothetical protein